MNADKNIKNRVRLDYFLYRFLCQSCIERGSNMRTDKNFNLYESTRSKSFTKCQICYQPYYLCQECMMEGSKYNSNDHNCYLCKYNRSLEPMNIINCFG